MEVSNGSMLMHVRALLVRCRTLFATR